MTKSKSPRTDLALEALDAAGGSAVGVKCEKTELDGMTVNRVRVTSDEGARAIGRPRGLYVTIDAPLFRRDPSAAFSPAAQAVAAELKKMLPLAAGDGVLIVGLGNRAITPDALGPRAVAHTIVTRHLMHLIGGEKSSFRPVSAIAPGVMGTTGIETEDIVRAVVQRTSPAAVIAVDALAARSLSRLASTFQLCDSGVSPGSGVGNRRAELSRAALGIPVIAIGVPTVVDAVTLACDALETALGRKDGSQKIEKAISSAGLELLVTPREIDELISNAAKTVGYGINMALHGIRPDEITSLLS